MPFRNHDAPFPKVPKRAFVLYLVITAIAMVPVWSVAYFVSQDGIAHVYNAYLMNALIDGQPEFTRYLSFNSFSVPNSIGHWLLVLLLRLFAPFTALKVTATLTFVGFVTSIGFLKSKAGVGRHSSEISALLASGLAFNWMWFLGFYNFTIAVVGFVWSITLYLRWRDKMNWLRTLILSFVITISYLSHIVPFVIAVSSLIFLAAFSQGRSWVRNVSFASVACLPGLVLMALYRYSVGVSESFAPAWRTIGNGSFSSIVNQLRSVDPFVLISRTTLPFTGARSAWFALFAPSLWIAIAVMVLVWPTVKELAKTGFDDRLSTALLVLLVGWTLFAIVGPDDFGITNGGILRDRVLLCGSIFAVPLTRIPNSRSLRLFVVTILAVAVIFQTAALWDYSRVESSVASKVLAARSAILDEDSVLTIAVVQDGMRFHSVPEPNLGVILGIGRDTLVWDNYELGYTLFPILTKDGADRRFFYQVSISHSFKPNDPKEHFDETFERLTELMKLHHDRFTKVVLLGKNDRIEGLLANWFDLQPIFENDELRVFRHRD